ncbi:hypothetical protein [Salinicola sp. CR57]|uniref:gp53-like domain-containing protein n=1 Tax=Salinicola sp. CR57 TaxID=1949086 RepID=UPI000DA1FCED|nr:hypothetical protein [Salinicola sp. CR57]
MAIVFTITDAGRAALVDPDNNGTNAVVIAEVGLGSGRYAPTKDQTELEAPIKRVDTIAGQAVSDDTLHVTVQDETADAYQVGEIGLFTDAGVLFAVYSQSDWIIEKAAPATLLLATDLVVESLDVSSITFGDAAFLNPPASTTVKGVLELATQEEVDAGTDRLRAVVPRTLKAFIDRVLAAYATVKQLTDHAASRDHPAANTNNQGMVELATYQETKDGADNTRAVTPAANKAALDQHRQETGAHAGDRISLGALAKLGNPKTVQAALATLGTAAVRDEGSGKGLDADKLDGLESEKFMRSDVANAVLLLGNREAGDVKEDGAVIFDHSHGIFVYMDSPPIGTEGPYAVMTAATTQAGNNIEITGGKGKDSIPTISVKQGSGSGLDADKLDGLQASQFIRSDAKSQLKGELQVDSDQGLIIVYRSAGGLRLSGFANGETHFIHGPEGNGDDIFRITRRGKRSYEISVGNGGGFSELWHANNLNPIKVGAANQTVGDGFHVNGNKFYFGTDGNKEHNLFDNDGAGNAGLQFGMDKDKSTAVGGAVEFQADIDNSDNSAWRISLDSRKRNKGDSINFDQELLGSRSGLQWNGNNIWHEGDAARSRGTSGYVKNPDGTIIQWGEVNNRSGGNSGGAYDTWKIGFPITFPNACRQVIPSFGNLQFGGSSRAMLCAEQLENNRFQLAIGAEQPYSGQTVRYIAVGY